MAVEDLLKEFSQSRELIAFRVSSSELSGIFSRRLSVPAGACALVVQNDGSAGLLSAGQEAGGKFEATIVRTGDLPLSLGFLGLRSHDGFPIDARATVVFRVDHRTVASLRAFSQFMGAGHYRIKDLEEYVVDRIRAVCASLASSASAKDLHARDVTGQVESLVSEKMQVQLMGTGLLFEKVSTAEFLSKEYEREISRVSRAVKSSQQREKRMKELAEFLQKEGSVRSLLEQVQDPKLKSLLVARLVLKEGGEGSDLSTHLDERALDEVYRTMQHVLSGDAVSMEEIVSDSAVRIYAVLGPKVVEVEPAEPYETRARDIGEGLRSVRFASVKDQASLLLGTKRGCILFDLESEEKRVYPLPDIRQPRGGVNAVALNGTSLFSTHSEFGLAMWDVNRPGRPAELLYDSITSAQKTTRAVQISGDRLLFASGADVYSILLTEPSGSPVAYRGGHGPVTAVVCSGASLFASTEDGAILQWDLAQPEYPSVLLRKNDPIYALRLAKLRGVGHLVYSFNDTSVHARVLGQTMEVEFEALGTTFTQFDVASDLVCACGQRGRSLFLWKPSSPRRPVKTIDLSKIETREVMDLCLRKGRRANDV
jgi:hypothetical protein